MAIMPKIVGPNRREEEITRSERTGKRRRKGRIIITPMTSK